MTKVYAASFYNADNHEMDSLTVPASSIQEAVELLSEQGLPEHKITALAVTDTQAKYPLVGWSLEWEPENEVDELPYIAIVSRLAPNGMERSVREVFTDRAEALEWVDQNIGA